MSTKKIILFISIVLNILFIGLSIKLYSTFKEDISQYIIRKNKSADITMLGDSHTMRGQWNSLLDQNVLKIGKGGNTSEQIKGFRDDVILNEPKTIFILCGGNNLNFRHYDIDELFMDYEEMYNYYKDYHLVFQSIPLQRYEKNNPEIKKINSRLEKFCKDRKIGYLYLEFDKTMLVDDGVHLNKNGYKYWADQIQFYLASTSSAD